MYGERPNEPAFVLCSGPREQKPIVRRLECHFQVRRDDVYRFFAAVSETGDVGGSNRTVPEERFYCSTDDWLKISGEPRAPTVQPKNASAVLSAATEMSPGELLSSCRRTVDILLLVVTILCAFIIVVIIVVAVIVFRWLRRTGRGRALEKSASDEGENRQEAQLMRR